MPKIEIVPDLKPAPANILDKTEITNEAKALADIVEWSKECCSWQRDALRRLSQGQVDESDVAELVALCKGASKKAVPLAAEHVKDSAAANATINLNRIHSVQNVNALAEGESLSFDKSGVTVIYGDNGSGKSGYIRILKKICRARSPKGEKIEPNIYATKSGSQKAVVDFSVNSQNQSVTWNNAEVAAPLLSSVSVFDSRTANVHVDQTNDVAYTPFAMKVLEDLAQLCQRIKQTLTAEIQAIVQQTPAALKPPKCRPHTQVGKLFEKLDGQTDPRTVRALAALSVPESTRLEALNIDLASDPVKKSRSLQAQKAQLDSRISALKSLHAAATQERLDSIRQIHRRYQAAVEAATLAAQNLFADEPLPEIGTPTWRALWEAARTYSQRQAYPSNPFPFAGKDSRCVLCQQPLDAAAADRLGRFESFIKDESKKHEQTAYESYRTALEDLKRLNVPLAELRAFYASVQDDLDDSILADQIRKSGVAAKWRLRFILRSHSLIGATDLATSQPLPLETLNAHAAGLSTRAAALIGESQSDERKKLTRELEELEDRKWLAVVQDDVIAEIGRHKETSALALALKDTTTNRITTKSAEVAEELVTNALRAQFVKEVDRLGVSQLAIELRKEKSSYGTPLFRIVLIKKPETKVGDILSEGEHRCIALAAFLAELSTTGSHSALVFDDPVSSLDHLHRESLAKRFAAEGQFRQVIIFTHDIAFLFLLNEACHELDTHIGFRCITRGPELAGFCQTNPPPNAQPVEMVIEAMQKQLDNQKIQYERGEQEAWYKTVRSLQEQLRTTWERAVEEAVAPVIKRLANKVDTKGLAKLTAIDLNDCEIMRQAFGRCSRLLHSTAEILNPPLPKPALIQTEIDTLRNWVSDIRVRQGKIDAI